MVQKENFVFADISEIFEESKILIFHLLHGETMNEDTMFNVYQI